MANIIRNKNNHAKAQRHKESKKKPHQKLGGYASLREYALSVPFFTLEFKMDTLPS